MLGSFVAGRYSASWDSEDIGITKNGYELKFSEKAHLINRSDMFQQTLLETIQAGGDWTLSCEGMEWKAGPLDILTQFQGTLGDVGTISELGSANGVALTLTVTADTSAANAGDAINTLMAESAILQPGCDISLLFDSTLREFPIRVQLLPPATSGGFPRHFSTT